MTRREPVAAPAAFGTFNELLRYLRHQARLTHHRLTEATGCTAGDIIRYEHGQGLPDPAVVRARFVPALGLDHGSPAATQLLHLLDLAHRHRPKHAAAPHHQRPARASRAELAADPSHNIPVLRIKLFVPRPRAGLVARPRLMERLAGVFDVPLTLVAALAGCGKTTLLTVWARAQLDGDIRPGPARQRRCASGWLTLDSSDNDPAIFLRYLVTALQSAVPSFGAASLAMLQSAPAPPLATLRTLLLNDLAAVLGPVVLVLDDYHAITNPSIHDLMSFFVEHLPAKLHLVVATREDPPLPLPRLRGRQHVMELRSGDLRFSVDEAAAFLHTSMSIDATPEDVAALESRTEGWIAGLQLAALALRDRGDPREFIAAFSGSHRFVIDYLGTEVLDRLPDAVRSFLVQTSILERLCGPLCDAVLDLPDAAPSDVTHTAAPSPGQAMLEKAERLQLFVIALDETREWYRYHHLFADVLRGRLHRDTAEAGIAALHRRACPWFESQGLIDEAITHAVAAESLIISVGTVKKHVNNILGKLGVHSRTQAIARARDLDLL